MNCLYCNYPRTLVKVTRTYHPPGAAPYTARTRECAACKRRFVSREEAITGRMNKRTGEIGGSRPEIPEN